MVAFKDSLLEAIRALLLDTLSLSDEITQRLDESIFVYNFTVHLCLTTVDPELKSLAISLGRLSKKLSLLDDGIEHRQLPVILTGYSSCIKTLKSYSLDAVGIDGFLSYRLTIHWYQRMFRFSAKKSRSSTESLLYLSTLQPQPPSDFQKYFGKAFLSLKGTPFPPLPSCADTERGGKPPWDLDGVTPGVAAAWISIFRHPMNNYEPQEYLLENSFTFLVEETVPEYANAAVLWPLYAEKYWSSLRPQVFGLFNPTNPLNFINWVLEYAKKIFHLYPFLGCSEHVIDLTDALCQGDITSLHIAAALGLPSLCKDLMSIGQDCNKNSILGTPLWCAMLGPRVLIYNLVESTSRWEPPTSDTSFFGHQLYLAPNRSRTIHALLDSGASTKFVPDQSQSFANPDNSDGLDEPYYSFPGENVEPTMTSMAFWASVILEDHLIIKRVMDNGRAFDTALRRVMKHIKIRQMAKDETIPLLAAMATALDCSLRRMVVSKMYRSTSAEVVFLMMDPHRFLGYVSIVCPDIEDVTYEGCNWLAWSAFSNGYSIVLSRVALDSRFNADCLDPRSKTYHGTMLHEAIRRDDFEMVRVLLKHGADLYKPDRKGRIPLMLVESADMLTELVMEHGASITHTDRDGRTIWHYFAANNEIFLLEWLCENDKQKEANLLRKTKAGNTPLAEALLYIDTLQNQRSLEGTEPEAARYLLKHCSKKSHISSTRPLVHVAAEWGELELIEGLVRIGADFKEEDKDERTALHWMNPSASERVVKRLQELCNPSRIADKNGMCPLQTIILNTLGSKRRGLRSAHPACRGPLSKTAYSQLLTPQMRAWKDSRGRGMWKLFVDEILLPSPSVQSGSKKKHIRLFYESVIVALTVLIDSGTMADHERDTGESAILCLYNNGVDKVQPFPTKAKASDFPLQLGWNVVPYYPFFQPILEKSDPSLAEKFFKDSKASFMLAEVAVGKVKSLVSFLCSRGVSMAGGDLGFKNVDLSYTPLEFFLRKSDNLDMLRELLQHTTPEDLSIHQNRIYASLSASEAKEERQAKILKMLFKAGMSPDPVGEGHVSILALSIKKSKDDWITTEILNAKANPYVGNMGYSALMASAEKGHLSYLTRFLRDAPADYNWSTKYIVGERIGYNIFHAVASSGHGMAASNIVQELEKRGEDVPALVNGITDDEYHETPAHLVLRIMPPQPKQFTIHKILDLLQCLAENGADFTLRDRGLSNGATPLHVAVRNQRDSRIVQCLVDTAPQAATMQDDTGKTPVDWALWFRREEIINVFKEHGLI